MSTSRAQSIPQRISIRRYYASLLWRGYSKKAVFAVALLVVASLTTSIVLLPYIFPGEPAIRLDMRFVLQSNSTADVFSTNCSWSAYRVEHDVYGTHIRWLEEYSELLVETEGPLTDAITESGAVYISWNEIHFYGNDTWALQVDLYVFGADVRLWIDGNESTTTGISTEIRPGAFLEIHQDLTELGIEGVDVVADVAFFAESLLWSEASRWAYGPPHEYADVEAGAQDLFIGTLAVEHS